MTRNQEPHPDGEPKDSLREKFGGLLLVLSLIVGVWRDKIATNWGR